jgi:hypothetical protein
MRENAKTYSFALDSAGTATYTSETINLEHCWGFSFHALWTRTGGAIAGSFKSQKSNDGSYWIDYDSTVIANAATGHTEDEHADSMFRYVRFVANLTSGTATFQVNTMIKGF